MSKLARKLQKIFSETSSENGQFGSGTAGTKVLSDDLDTIQSLAAWLGGWSDAVVGDANLPTLEEMNGVQYTITSQLKYLFQQGIPEYLSTETYYQYSIVIDPSTFSLYGSLIDNNTGNALTDTASWKLLLNLTPISSTKSTDYTITDIDKIDTLIVTSGAKITLPTPGDNIGRSITIYNDDSSLDTTILRDSSSDRINGQDTDMNLAPGESFIIKFIAANKIISK